MNLNRWNKLVGFSVVTGMLVSYCFTEVMAGEPGAEQRPVKEVRVEEPNYGSLPRLLEGQTLPPEPLPQGVDSWEVSSPSGPPAGMDAATLREWRQYQREQHQYELEVRRQEQQEQLAQQRWQQQQQREQQRYQYQQQRDWERYQYQQSRNSYRYQNQYQYGGYSGGGYGGYRPRYQNYGHGYYGGHSCHGGSQFGIHFGF